MGPRIFGIIALHAPVVAVIRSHDLTQHLDHVQWADWDAQGRLLVATDEGRLQIRDGANGSVQWEADENAFEPDPAPPPAEASVW